MEYTINRSGFHIHKDFVLCPSCVPEKVGAHQKGHSHKKKLKYMEINQPENVKTKMCRTRAGYIVNFIAKMINMLISTVTEQLKNFLVVHL